MDEDEQEEGLDMTLDEYITMQNKAEEDFLSSDASLSTLASVGVALLLSSVANESRSLTRLGATMQGLALAINARASGEQS